jgi:glycosyltransferase involved in cell wall biosynthesis
MTCHLDLGGSTTFLCNLGPELLRHGADVRIFSFSRNVAVAEEFSRVGLQVVAQDERSQIFEDRMSRIIAGLSEFDPTCVVACLGPESFEALRYVPDSVFKLGLAQSDEASVYKTLRAYKAFMNAVGGVSLATCENLRPLELAVHYLPYGVPMPQQVEPKPIDSPRPLRILYLGRLCREQKRAHLFPRLLEELRRTGVPFRWTIAGSGELEEPLQQEMQGAVDEGIVHFLGFVPYGEVPKLLAEHDIFLLPSEYEGLPLSLLEAMGAGLVPVVTALRSGVPDAVDTTSGITVPVDDLSGYAKAIQILHEDRTKLQSMSRAARSRALERFSISAMADQWLQLPTPENPRKSEWNPNSEIKPPLTAKPSPYYKEPLRTLRRWVKVLNTR